MTNWTQDQNLYAQVVSVNALSGVIHSAQHLHSLVRAADGVRAPDQLITGWVEDKASDPTSYDAQINASVIIACGIAEAEHPYGFAHEAIAAWMRRNRPLPIRD